MERVFFFFFIRPPGLVKPPGDFPRRSLLAFVTRTEALGDTEAARTSYEFDCLDIRSLDGQMNTRPSLDDDRPYALLRIVTTPRRFRQLAGTEPSQGEWYLLEIAPKPASGIPTWHAQLGGNGYSNHSRGVTVHAERISRSDQGPERKRSTPRSLGAAAAPAVIVPKSLLKSCGAVFGYTKSKTLAAVLNAVPQATSVLVRDVGQANFISLCDDQNNSLLHFDVGYPISFNMHTRPPKRKTQSQPGKAPVILSHWDWDHLHAAHFTPALLDCKWIVPDQRIGPGAAKLANKLNAKGNLLVRSATNGAANYLFGRIFQCNGPKGDMNNTGLALTAKLVNGHSILITGDAAYVHVPTKKGARFKHLIAAHHGARIKEAAGKIPKPLSSDSKLVVSYGHKNVYRHPHLKALAKHVKAGWVDVLTTAKFAFPKGKKRPSIRGDKKLA